MFSTSPGPAPADPGPFRDRVLERANDPNWGYHRRPNGRVSEDIIAWNAPGGSPHWIWDMVSGSTGGSPSPAWNDVTGTIEPGSVFVPFCP